MKQIWKREHSQKSFAAEENLRDDFSQILRMQKGEKIWGLVWKTGSDSFEKAEKESGDLLWRSLWRMSLQYLPCLELHL